MKTKHLIAITSGSLRDYTRERIAELAEECGKISTIYGLVLMLIDENRMTLRLAQGAKKGGGKIIGLFSQGKSKYAWLYDEMILTENGNLSNVLEQTCMGLVVIGIPNDGNLKFGDTFPVAALTSSASGNKPGENPRKLGYSSFNNAKDALLFIIERNFGTIGITAREAYQRALETKNRCYPFGREGEYLRGAEEFLQAALVALGNREHRLWSKGMANYFNSMGDQFYYHVEDFFMAASLYHKALSYLETIEKEKDKEKDELLHYLHSIIIESIALALERVGETSLAKVLSIRSAESYDYAIKFASKASLGCYMHTVSGLKGYSKYLEAKEKIRERSMEDAERLISESKRLYKVALTYHPLWKKSGFSDSYGRAQKEISELEDTIKKLKGKGKT